MKINTPVSFFQVKDDSFLSLKRSWIQARHKTFEFSFEYVPVSANVKNMLLENTVCRMFESDFKLLLIECQLKNKGVDLSTDDGKIERAQAMEAEGILLRHGTSYVAPLIDILKRENFESEKAQKVFNLLKTTFLNPSYSFDTINCFLFLMAPHLAEGKEDDFADIRKIGGLIQLAYVQNSIHELGDRIHILDNYYHFVLSPRMAVLEKRAFNSQETVEVAEQIAAALDVSLNFYQDESKTDSESINRFYMANMLVGLILSALRPDYMDKDKHGFSLEDISSTRLVTETLPRVRKLIESLKETINSVPEEVPLRPGMTTTTNLRENLQTLMPLAEDNLKAYGA